MSSTQTLIGEVQPKNQVHRLAASRVVLGCQIRWWHLQLLSGGR
jgi:hypothetical protein